MCHTNSRSSFPVVPFAVAGTLVAGGLLWARLNAPPPVPVCVIAGLDASDSVRGPLPAGSTLLGRSRAALARLAASLQSGLDRLIVARVDRETDEFYSQSAPDGSEAFLRLLMNHTQTRATHSGTFPANFFTLAAARAADVEQAPGKAVEIAYYGDADNDDLTPASRAEIAAAARRLAANPRVAGVWMFGANPENWAGLRALLSPLHGRFHLAPRDELAPQPLLDEIDHLRRS